MEMDCSKCERPGPDRQGPRENRRRNRPHQGGTGRRRPEGEPMTTIHHKTRKAADISLAKRQISPTSHRAVLAGEITLQYARDLGRDGAPRAADATDGPGSVAGRPRSPSAEDGQDRTDTRPQPVSRISKDDTTQECWCGCQELTSPNRKWRPGHDQRAKGIIRRAVKEGKVDELSRQLR